MTSRTILKLPHCVSAICLQLLFFLAYADSFATEKWLQAQIRDLVQDIPILIEQTLVKVTQSRQTFNFRKIVGATGIALGKLLQVRRA